MQSWMERMDRAGLPEPILPLEPALFTLDLLLIRKAEVGDRYLILAH